MTNEPARPRESISELEVQARVQPVGNREETGGLEQVTEQLAVQRIELEMQDRALREMRAELESAVARYTALYDCAPVGYMTVTPQGKIFEANARAAGWLRTGRAEVMGRNLRAFLSHDDAARVGAFLDECGRSGLERCIEATLRLPDGGSKVVALSARATKGANDAVQIHVALTEIEQLRRAERLLEGANSEIDALCHSISHDLRAPLVSIVSYGSILLEDHSNLDPAAREMIERMRKAAERLGETLSQLLAYSRLARQAAPSACVNLDEVVHEVLVEHRALIQYRKARIDVRHPLPSVLGVRALVEQMLRNLLSNALKYTLPGEPPSVTISATTHGATVLLQVIDQGIGIDPKHQDRLFKLFERLQPHSQYPGAGVGLAIVRRAVERMSGNVWLKSEPGKGCTIFVELPAG